VFKFRQQVLTAQQQTQGLTPGYDIGVELENVAGSGEVSGVKGAELTISLSSVLEMGGKRDARLEVVNQRQAQLQAQQKVTALNILGEVTHRYIDVLTAQARVALAQEATSLAEDTLNTVEQRAKAGAAPSAEVKRAMAAVGHARLTAASESQQFEHSKRILALLWNETTPIFTSVTGDLFEFGKTVSFEALLAKVEQNPALMVFASEQRLKQAQLRLANTQANADISWSVGLKRMQDINETALSAGFTMPLFAPQRNHGVEAAARHQLDLLSANKQTTLLQLRNQLYQAYANREQAIYTAHHLKTTIIPVHQQALDETQSAYQLGRYSYLDYLTARQELLFARRALIDAASAALRYGVDIEQLINEPLTTLNQGTQP
jgi:cobalt-zinc-cadmium efflux system outer membrane protein